jgi:DNA polymerase-1
MNLIVDFNNTVHRARAGFSRGEHHVTYTFMLMLKKMAVTFKPSRLYIVKEGKARARRELFEEYKANRESAGDDFWRQHSEILELLALMPVNILRHAERECDDTIAHICEVIRKDEECIIVSSDSDFTQLLKVDNDRVKLYNPIKDAYVSATPYDYVEWKALVGDGSDNIPGFKGIGPKRAEKLLLTPGALESFLNEGDNKAFFNRNTTLIRFEKIDVGLESKEPSSEWEALKEKLTAYNFNSIINDKNWKKFVESFSTIVG